MLGRCYSSLYWLYASLAHGHSIAPGRNICAEYHLIKAMYAIMNRFRDHITEFDN